MISISIDNPEDRGEIVKFLRKAKPSFTVVHDASEAARKAFGVEPIPVNVALDATGKIVAVASGDAGELDRAVALLAKPRRAAR